MCNDPNWPVRKCCVFPIFAAVLRYKHCLEKCQECGNLLWTYQTYEALQSSLLSSSSWSAMQNCSCPLVYGCSVHIDKACHILAYQKQTKDSLIVMNVTCNHYPRLIYCWICHPQMCVALFYVPLSHMQTHLIVTHSKSVSCRKLLSVNKWWSVIFLLLSTQGATDLLASRQFCQNNGIVNLGFCQQRIALYR